MKNRYGDKSQFNRYRFLFIELNHFQFFYLLSGQEEVIVFYFNIIWNEVIAGSKMNWCIIIVFLNICIISILAEQWVIQVSK